MKSSEEFLSFFLCSFKVTVAKTITKQRPRNRTKIQEGVVERKSSIFSDLFWTPAQKNGKGREGKKWTLLERGIASTTTTYRLYYLIQTHLAEATTLCYMSNSNVGIWGAILGIESILCCYNEEVFLMLKWVKCSVTNWSDLCPTSRMVTET